MPNPVDNPTAYDFFILGGRRSPGKCDPTMGGAARDEGWDKQEAKGSDGGETVHNGAKLIEFDVDLYLWKDEKADHFAAWEQWKSTLRLTTKDNNQALDIYHPVLDEIDLKSVVVKIRSGLLPDGQGGAHVKLRFIEYGPPKKKTASGKPAGSKGVFGQPDTVKDFSIDLFGGGGSSGTAAREPKPKPPDPNADKKARLAAKTAELEALGGGP